jgi:hypothetical protein
VRAGSFAGRCPRDQGPPAVLGASRLFVLLVAARRWVLAGNNKIDLDRHDMGQGSVKMIFDSYL